MYRRLRRRFRFAGNVAGRRFHSTVGILQGCPLSVTLLTAIMSVLMKAMDTCTTCEDDIPETAPVLRCPDAHCQACHAKPLVLCPPCAAAHGVQVESFADDGKDDYEGAHATQAMRDRSMFAQRMMTLVRRPCATFLVLLSFFE
eukprot:gene12727-732_t